MPTFEKMKEITRQLGQNALAIKVSFGGGKKVCLGEVFNAEKFLREAGESWTVPQSEGSYPTCATGDSEQEKKKRISDFIRTETDIKIVEATQYLLKALFIGCIDKCYIK